MSKLLKLYKTLQTFFKNNVIYIFLALFLLSSFTTIKGFWGPATIGGAIYRTLIACFVIFCSAILIPLLAKKKRNMLLLLLAFSTLFFIVSIFTGVISVSEPDSVKVFVAFDNLARNITSVLVLVSFYCCFKNITSKSALVFLGGIVFFAVFASLYGLIFDTNDFVNVLIDKEGQNFDFDSFFLTKNYFGIIISLALMSLAIIPRFFTNIKNKTVFIILDVVVTIFLFFVLIVTRAKTSILLTIVFYLVYLFFAARKRNKLLLFSIALFSLLSIFLLWFFIPAFYDSFSLSKKFHYFLDHTIVNDSWVVLGSRFNNWGSFLSTFSWKIVFGLGDRSFYYLLRQDTNIISLDNTYLTFLGQGGIFKITLFIATFLIIFKCLEKDGAFYKETWLLFAIILTYGLFLDFSFNNLSFESYAFIGLIAISNFNLTQKLS